MKKISSLGFAAFLVLGILSAQAADLAGSKDYPLIKRYEGSEIIGYKTNAYDEFTLALGKAAGGQDFFDKKQGIEGPLTEITYRVPGAHSSLEIFSNYKNALTAAGFQPLFETEMVKPIFENYFRGTLYKKSDQADALLSIEAPHYLAAKLAGADKDVYVALVVVESDGWQWHKQAGRPVTINKGDVVVALDVIETKPLVDRMVVIKSSEMADAIAKTGKIDIYGITFDIDKTDIKPESVPTLVEVAKLLQENPTLKLQISGHTDNTGSATHNQTLSEGRAASVVNTLVSQYHVDASRLQAKGYGDTRPVADNATEEGRAKNRRVELSKLQ